MTMINENQNIVNQNQMNIMSLPEEILYMITEKLNEVRDVVAISMVNKKFKNIAKTCDMSEMEYYNEDNSNIKMSVHNQYPDNIFRDSINCFKSNDITKYIRNIKRFNKSINLHVLLYKEYICPGMSEPKTFTHKQYEKFAKYCTSIYITGVYNKLNNFENFTNVKKLDIWGGDFAGGIPRLDNLEYLCLENCNFEENTSIPYMKNLKRITLNMCQDICKIDTEIGNKLERIIIRDCRRIDISNLYNIKYLTLRELDNIKDIPSNFKNEDLTLVQMDNLEDISTCFIKNLTVRRCKYIDDAIIMNLTKFGINIEYYEEYEEEESEEEEEDKLPELDWKFTCHCPG